MARPQLNLSLYLVLDPVLCAGELGMLRTAEIAAKSGATVIQLRAPGWDTEQLICCGKKLKDVLDPLGTALIVNNDAVAAKAIGAAGLHVGQSDMSPKEARALLGNDVAIGLSITKEAQLTDVDYSLIDYIGAGPVWKTATKKDAAPAMGLDEFSRIAKASCVPTVAIGGIGISEARLLQETPAAGIAVVSAICGQKDIALATKALRDTFLLEKNSLTH